MNENFIKEFNEVFGTQLNETKEQNKMLYQLFYDYIIQEFRMSKLYHKMLGKLLEIEDELKENLTDEGKKLFEKYETYKDEIGQYESQQSFFYGYCMDKQIQTEKNNYKGESN